MLEALLSRGGKVRKEEKGGGGGLGWAGRGGEGLGYIEGIWGERQCFEWKRSGEERGGRSRVEEKRGKGGRV